MMSGATRTPENISTVVIQFAYSGRIKLGQPIRDMVRARETEKEGSKLCQGERRVSERAADLSEMHQFFQVQDHDQVPHTRN